MMYKPLAKKTEVKAQDFTSINKSRKNFVVVEWGGFEIGGSEIK